MVLNFSFQSQDIFPRYISTSFYHPNTSYGRTLHMAHHPAQCCVTNKSTAQIPHWMPKSLIGLPFHPSPQSDKWLEFPCQLTSDVLPSYLDVNSQGLHLHKSRNNSYWKPNSIAHSWATTSLWILEKCLGKNKISQFPLSPSLNCS